MRVPRQGREEERWRAYRCDGVVTSFLLSLRARGRCIRSIGWAWKWLLCGFLVPLPSVRYASARHSGCAVSSARLVTVDSCTDPKTPRLSDLGRGSPARRSAARRHAGSLGALRRRPLLARAAIFHPFDASALGRRTPLWNRNYLSGHIRRRGARAPVRTSVITTP